MHWPTRALLAVTLLAAVETALPSRAQTQNPPPSPARSPSAEMLDRWNDIGNKLIAMAKDFPEDKYDFKVQKDERSFAENLLHVAAVDFDLAGRISGRQLGPDSVKDTHSPSRELFKTKAEVVKLLQQAVADGASVIK